MNSVPVNNLLPFFLEKISVRGRMAYLESLPQTILKRHNYPEVVNRFLADLITLSVALANVVKYEGMFTLQIQGDQAPVKFMVVDVSSEGHVRACANFDEKLIAGIEEKDPSLHQLFGGGTLAFTVDQGDHTERYQGIVDLQGVNLRDCLQHYFHQSEQLETAFFLHTTEDLKSCCIMIQKLPFDQKDQTKEQDYDDWFTALSLLSTLKSEEVFSKDLTCEDILHRLFWQEGLSYFDPKLIIFKCRCNREKIEHVLSNISPAERESIAEDHKITVTCDFCSEDYIFDA